MSRSRSQLAKLTRPRLHNTVVRERLFDILDEARGRPILWIAGPPGAGKTTLVASYAESAQLPCIWYQVDRGDADPATFFYFLRQAAASAVGSRAQRLPLLRPEYLSDLAGFTRRYFRSIFSWLEPGAMLVLDNYQEAGLDAPLHTALDAAAQEIPDDANLIIISRTEPPPPFARTIVSDLVSTIGWDALRLTLEETGAVAQARVDTDSQLLRSLFELSNGWVAGVTLLLEQLHRDGSLCVADAMGPNEVIFDYFASQIFDAAPPETRDLLLKTALFPSITPSLATVITGNPHAGRLLELLHRRRLFVERRQGPEVSYQFHTLFRAFLHHRALRQYSAEETEALSAQAAQLLAAQGREEDAFPLYCQTGDWARASELLVTEAPTLIGQGRLQTVLQWASRLPDESLAGNPWIEYWVAMALETVQPCRSRERLKKAFDAFRDRCDEMGQMMSAAGIIDTIHTEFVDFVQMDPWIDVLARCLVSSPAFQSREAELRANLSLLGAIHRAPGHPLLQTCARRVETLLREPLDVNLRVAAAQRLGSFADLTSDFDLWDRVAADIAPALDAPTLAPSNMVRYLDTTAYHHYLAGRVDESLACYERVRRIASKEGLSDAEFRATVYMVICKRRAGRLASAERSLAELASFRKPERGALLAVYEHARSLMAYSRGDTALALTTGQAALQIVANSGNLYSEVVLRVFNAEYLIAAHELDQANCYLKRARTLSQGTAIDTARAYIALNQAHVAHLQGDSFNRNAFLAEALELSRDRGGIVRLRWAPEAIAVLFPIALEEGIEAKQVKGLIRKLGIAPRAGISESWPWPVKVYTLGEFRVLCNDLPLEFGRKVPKKPLAMLQVIVALGGEDVTEQQVVDAIWPDEDGDVGHGLFTTTLHRLRKLLGNADVIRQSGKSLTISRDRCWVDCWAFQQLAGQGDVSIGGIQHAVELYRGDFLANANDAPWALAIRQRLKNKFIHAVASHGEELESESRFDDAIAWYQQGLDVDVMIEPFYQGMMRCYQRQQRHSEAIGTYRRLRQALSVSLGIPPSAASERLYQSFRSD